MKTVECWEKLISKKSFSLKSSEKTIENCLYNSGFQQKKKKKKRSSAQFYLFLILGLFVNVMEVC